MVFIIFLVNIFLLKVCFIFFFMRKGGGVCLGFFFIVVVLFISFCIFIVSCLMERCLFLEVVLNMDLFFIICFKILEWKCSCVIRVFFFLDIFGIDWNICFIVVLFCYNL